jgi:predicted negative regulator of RcsB-dependent stress response
MTKYRFAFLFALTATVAAVSSLSVQAQTRATCGCAFVSSPQPQNVRVLIAGENQPKPAGPYMVVHFGDVIKVARPVTGTLICDNVTGRIVLNNTPRNQPVPCKGMPEEGILIGRNGRKLEGATMGDATGHDFPVVLSPRSTRIFNPRPVLKWTSIPDANTYQVIIRGDTNSWSSSVTAVPNSEVQQIAYPPECTNGQSIDCAPRLVPGQNYKLIVRANDRSSEEEDLPNLGFALLPLEEIATVRRAVEALQQSVLGDSLKRKMLASLYANRGLLADAIEVLEGYKRDRNPEEIRLLGDLYLRIGLTRRAEASYLSLIDDSTANQDTPQGKAITHETLGEIYEALGNKQEAITHYSKARKMFIALKDSASIKKIQKRLLMLGPP